MNVELNKIAASTAIIVVSWIVLYHSCLRASTIYFFELDSTKVLFISGIHALLIPVVLSALLYFVYLGTKRSSQIQKEREMAAEKEKELVSASLLNSRKTSREFRKSSFSDETEQQSRIKRLLSDISEQDIESTIHEQKVEPVHDVATVFPGRFVVENVPEIPKVILPAETRSRSGSARLMESSRNSSRKSSLNGLGVARSSRNILSESEPDLPALYSKLADMDLFSYSLNALIPPKATTPRVYIKLGIFDVLSELLAIHVPIWACVLCLHIALLEFFGQHLSFYFYYHEESMAYASMALSFTFGIGHELAGGWVSNDVLAFASIYIVSSRIQAISFQTSVAFLVGMVIFDLFFIYVIDLLTVVTRENKAPLMITIPRDREGHQQSLATLDIMVPAIFLNVINKYSNMYDGHLFSVVFVAVFVSLMLTMVTAVYREKVTPAIVLPAVTAVVVSLVCSTHPTDLWKFMIKH